MQKFLTKPKFVKEPVPQLLKYLELVRRRAAFQYKLDMEEWPVDNPLCQLKDNGSYGGIFSM